MVGYLTSVRKKYIIRFYRQDIMINVGLALLLASGLVLSGLPSRLRTQNLFKIGVSWDPGILIALVVCLVLNSVFFTLIRKKYYRSLRKDEFKKPEPLTVKTALKLSLGSALMGASWGLSDMDSSSMLANLQFVTPHVSLVYLPAFVLGQLIAYLIGRLVGRCRQRAKENESKSKLGNFKTETTTLAMSTFATSKDNNEKIGLTDSKEFLVTKKVVVNKNDIELSDQFAVANKKKGGKGPNNQKEREEAKGKILSGKNIHSSLVIQKRVLQDSALSIT